MSYESSKNAGGESDGQVVPTKLPNKGEKSSAEAGGGKLFDQEEHQRDRTYRTQRRGSVSQGLGGVREAARRDKEQKFTTLLHHVTVELLRESYGGLKKQAAAGVDGVTWAQYGEGLEEKLQDLRNRIQKGSYRAQPSRRTYIPKADGRQRPLGIAALEDKIVQQAVALRLRSLGGTVAEEVWNRGHDSDPVRR